MNKEETDRLKAFMDAFEWEHYCITGMRQINGGYAKAEVTDVDEDKVDISLEWGEQDMGSGTSVCHTERHSIRRSVLDDPDMPMEAKIRRVES